MTRLKITHFGTADLAPGFSVECAVLEDGRRGFLQRRIVESIGFRGKGAGPRFSAFFARIGAKSLQVNEKSGSPFFEVQMPNGAVVAWVEYSFLREVIRAGTRAFWQGKLTKHQQHIGERCEVLDEALADVGMVALIDEATGYQYAREPDALQDLIVRLIREKASDWERRFHPGFYSAVCKLFGIQYGNRHRSLPPIIGKITNDWVYSVVFPPEIMAEIRTRQGRETLHQWLEEGGLKLLEKQIAAVETVARSSVDYKDFEARCIAAFPRPGQQVSMVYPRSAA